MKSHVYTLPTRALGPQETQPGERHPYRGRHARYCPGCRRRTWHHLEGTHQRCERCQQVNRRTLGA